MLSKRKKKMNSLIFVQTMIK